jgi:hypothetical protein
MALASLDYWVQCAGPREFSATLILPIMFVNASILPASSDQRADGKMAS